jgi:hypothetical protein
MDFPFIVETYEQTRSGKNVIAKETIHDAFELENFKNQYPKMQFNFIAIPKEKSYS